MRMDQEDVKWTHVADADIVFMHRPWTKLHKQIARLCLDYETPIWLDIDDHLFKIPHDNKSYEQYMDPEVQGDMISMLVAAKVVTTTTVELKKVLDRFRPENDTVIIKNAFLETRWTGYRNVDTRPTPRRVLWRGGVHHERDLEHVTGDIIQVANEYPGWEFWFVGKKPWKIIEETENCVSVSGTDVTSYFKILNQVRPDLTICPLFDNIFNRCKSNIAALEGLMAGGIVLAPDWEEWQGIPGVINYKPHAFKYELRRLIELCETDAFKQLNADGWGYICDSYKLEDQNKIRESAIEYLVNINQDFKLTVAATNLRVYQSASGPVQESKR